MRFLVFRSCLAPPFITGKTIPAETPEEDAVLNHAHATVRRRQGHAGRNAQYTSRHAALEDM